MDHLPNPRNPTHVPIEVPYVCKEDYDDGPFSQYLERKGWTQSNIIDSRELGKPLQDVQSILQTWLYFGILTEVFGEPIRAANFIRTNERGRKLITTSLLPFLASQWIQRERALPQHIRRRDESHACRCLFEVNNILTLLSLRDPNVLDRNLLLSFKVLFEYLLDARPFAYGSWDVSNGEWPVSFDYAMPGAEEVVLTRMMDDGCCPNEIQMLSLRTKASELYYTSNLTRPGPDKDHKNCSEDQCIAYQMDEKVYMTKHIEDGCSCAPIFASQDHLSRILCNEQGSIPLICPFKVVTADNEKPQVELIESGPGVNYVAISHIWSDGLSNVNENSIPQCQFNRLSRLVGNLYDGTQMPFWLDTLCFPLQPTEAYNLALIGMR